MTLPVTRPGADRSLAQMFVDRARGAGPQAGLRVKKGGGYVDVSYAAYADRVRDIAKGLFKDVDAGDAVAIFANTRAEWLAMDFAVLSLGGIVVPIYASVLAEECGYILKDAAVRVVVVEGKAQLEKVRAVRNGFSFFDVAYDRAALSRLQKIVVIDPSGVAPADDWESLADVEERGRALAKDDDDATSAAIDARIAAQTREAVCSYCYTSGTTGAPKGVVHTNENWLALLDVAGGLGMFTERTRETGVFLFLPLAHAFGRLIGLGAVYFQSVVVLATIETLLDDLQKARPGFVPSAPRMYEKMYAKLMATVAEAPPRRQKIFAWALAVGKKTIPYRQAHRPLPPLLKAQNAVAERLVFGKLRARLGLDRVDAMLSGSAPLAPAVQEFFVGIGITLIEAYGLTETTPGISANTPTAWKLGTVGKRLDCVTIQIAPDGEICAKGKNITQGYLNRPEATAEAFDADGWFHTGDIGELDQDGFLKITDRKKDIIKTSGGKYVAPQKIEGLLKARPLIAEAVVIGDNKKFCTALIVVDEEALQGFANRHEEAANKSSPAVHKHLQEQIDAVNAHLASYESIKAFRVVDTAFSVDNGLLTGSFKVKRKAVNTRFAALIDEMYTSAAAAHAKGD